MPGALTGLRPDMLDLAECHAPTGQISPTTTLAN
jgi:hypothetical protein